MSIDRGSEELFGLEININTNRSSSDMSGSGLPWRSCYVLYDFESQFPEEISLRAGSRVTVTSTDITSAPGWWCGENDEGKVGLFPASYLNRMDIASSQLELKEQVEHGYGGFSTVVRGFWGTQLVAVKKALVTADAMLVREAKFFTRLHHENIVKFLGFCQDRTPHYLILEYCAGGPLSRLLHRTDIIIEASVLLNWAGQIAGGMYYLHSEANLIHRDLKSSNVLIVENWCQAADMPVSDLDSLTLKISDFGLARDVGRSITANNIGTCKWMAPEVLRCEKHCYSYQSDVWSYGVLLWEMLSRKEPFGDCENVQVIFMVGTGRLRLPIPDACPEDLKQILTACLEDEKDKRPAFANLLEKLSCLKELAGNKPEYTKLVDNWQDELQPLLRGNSKRVAERMRKEANLIEMREAKHRLEREIERIERESNSEQFLAQEENLAKPPKLPERGKSVQSRNTDQQRRSSDISNYTPGTAAQRLWKGRKSDSGMDGSQQLSPASPSLEPHTPIATTVAHLGAMLAGPAVGRDLLQFSVLQVANGQEDGKEQALEETVAQKLSSSSVPSLGFLSKYTKRSSKPKEKTIKPRNGVTATVRTRHYGRSSSNPGLDTLKLSPEPGNTAERRPVLNERPRSVSCNEYWVSLEEPIPEYLARLPSFNSCDEDHAAIQPCPCEHGSLPRASSRTNVSQIRAARPGSLALTQQSAQGHMQAGGQRTADDHSSVGTPSTSHLPVIQPDKSIHNPSYGSGSFVQYTCKRCSG